MTTTHEFYGPNHRAPYLQVEHDADDSISAGGALDGSSSLRYRVSSQNSLVSPRPINRRDEADAAGGGGSRVVSRVGSFLNMPRVQSEITLRSAATNTSIGGGAPLTPENPKRSTDSLPDVQGLKPGEREEGDSQFTSKSLNQIKPNWRLRDKMRTAGVGLVMALNPGTDPPDVTKPYPCAVLQCWTDPRTSPRSAAKGIIVEKLEQQYAKWQLARTGRPMKYRNALDPTVEEVRELCVQLRRQAMKNERLLLHYNGHGVPRPTFKGEIWVFDKRHSEYIPLSVADLRQWLGVPSIVVLDCSSAGVLIPFWTMPLTEPPPSPPSKTDGSIDMEKQSSRWVSETIVLCACSENEWIPMNPEYPADVFTSCLTTPIKIALRWFVRRNQSMADLDPEAVDLIPGTANDRKTPLGELNWIFTAVTDSIAWNVLPRPLFQRLFRQDLLVASMFRNFLLADRILRSLGCTPVSHPPLPSGIAEHPLWEAWDLACETMLFKLIDEGILETTSPQSRSPYPHEQNASLKTNQQRHPLQPPRAQAQLSTNISSPFFSEQLAAFEVWLSFTDVHKMRLAKGELEPPEQLPVLLQVLLSPVLRIRALGLLRRFLDLGPWAVNLSLSLGIFPYVMKMLQSAEYKSLLVSIWASILTFDSSCRGDLLKEKAFVHFVQHLSFGMNASVMEVSSAAKERTLAAYVLSLACHEYPAGQAECARLNLHVTCCAILSSYQNDSGTPDMTADLHLPPHFRLWLCICVANMMKDNNPVQNEAYNTNVHSQLIATSTDRSVAVRAAVCYALGAMIGSKPKQGSRNPSTQDLPSLANPNQNGTPSRNPTFNPGQILISPPGVNAAIPQFTSPSGVPQNLQWNGSQPIQGMPGQIPLPQGQQISLQPPLQQGGQSFPMQQQPYMLPNQGMPGQPPRLGIPNGFLVGGSPLMPNQGPTPGFQNSPVFSSSPSLDTRPMRPSVFDDQQRLSRDCQVMEHICKMTKDASVIVRYEATAALAQAVGKYLDAFVVSADPPGQDIRFPVPRGLDNRTLERFRTTWKVIRSIQHEDPFPIVSRAANEIVSVVHEVVLKFKMENEPATSEKGDTMAFHTKKLASILAGIEEDGNGDNAGLDLSTGGESADGGKSHEKESQELRRVASEIATGHTSLENAAKSLALGTQSPASGVMPTNYLLPESSFYRWKKDTFDVNFSELDEQLLNVDPLSPQGVTRAYRERRNHLVKQKGYDYARHFSPLIPKPPQPARKSIEMMLEEEAEEDLGFEAEVKRSELKFKERVLLKTGMQQTSMLCFHPFEDYIMACCDESYVSMWQTTTGQKAADFHNGNRRSARMTTSTWVNEEASSMFLVGCDDGTVRLWGDLIRSDGQPGEPSLVSSFTANATSGGKRRMVCEWQQYRGSLLAGGSSPTVNCWDLEAEKEVIKLPTNENSDVCVTTLTTAWDYDSLGMGPGPRGYKGLGREVFVAGLSNGTLKVFDLRASTGVTTIVPHKNRDRREHKTWIVSTTFTAYGGKYELVSGSTDGSMKMWDLRMSSSIRTIEAQRSLMTALAVHPKIPVAATGSGAQFIKVLTLDGETLQAIRNHEANVKMGPVSCLAFHPYKPLLASGATDSFIGIYGPTLRL